jgi:hypothetical protein
MSAGPGEWRVRVLLKKDHQPVFFQTKGNVTGDDPVCISVYASGWCVGQLWQHGDKGGGFSAEMPGRINNSIFIVNILKI